MNDLRRTMSVTSRKQGEILNWVLQNKETIEYVLNKFIFTDEFDKLPSDTRKAIASIRKEYKDLDFNIE